MLVLAFLLHNHLLQYNLILFVPGSVALAAITALVRNREYKRWFQAATLSFSFSPAA